MDLISGPGPLGISIDEDELEAAVKAKLFDYIGSDLTQNDYTGGVAEVVLATILVPANTVSTGLLIIAHVWRYDHNSTVTGAVKVGPTGSEVLKYSFPITRDSAGAAGSAFGEHGTIMWYATGETWTNDVTVLITGTLANALDNVVCDTVVVMGW